MNKIKRNIPANNLKKIETIILLFLLLTPKIKFKSPIDKYHILEY